MIFKVGDRVYTPYGQHIIIKIDLETRTAHTGFFIHTKPAHKIGDGALDDEVRVLGESEIGFISRCECGTEADRHSHWCPSDRT